MANSAADIQQLYIAYFNRPADPIGLAYWQSSTMSLKAIAESFAVQTEYSALYAGKTTAQVINTIYNNLFGHDADAAGLLYWAGEVGAARTTLGNAALLILKGATGADAIAIASKTTAATSFTTSLDLTTEIVAYAGTSPFAAAKAWLAGVTTDPSLASAIATKDAVIAGFTGSTVAGQTLSLTTGLDSLVGTSVADTFLANVVQNSLGAQTNQLATGDKIVGGGGIDTLTAVVQLASALNNSPASAITPITTGVEKAMFTALTVNQSALSTAETVYINAKSMTGLTNVGSVQSDASLFIENLTTLTDTGVYADRRNTDSITIRMDHSGNDKAADKESNLTVLFDNDYLRSDATNKYQLTIEAVNNLPLKNSQQPLQDFALIKFSVGPKDVVVTLTDAIRNTVNTAGNHEAYDALIVAINAQLVADGLSGSVTATLGVAIQSLFSIDFPTGTGGNTGAAVLKGDVAGLFNDIIITSTLDPLAVGQIALQSSKVAFNGANNEIVGLSSTAVLPITSNIELLKVGRGAEGGSLVVGAMSTDGNNVWDYSATALKEGVEKFIVKVSGDTTQMSSLSNVSSTNNTLQTVDVSWDAGSLADLIIGNHNTTGVIGSVNGANTTVDGVANVSSVQNLALKDVRTFTTANNNSATIKNVLQTNDVTVNAYLSDEVVAKYMDRAHTASIPASAKFTYTTAAGNDTINLNISKTNLSESGSATREDFSLAINAGAGDNTVVTQIGDGTGTNASAWYLNQSIQKNLSIVTGAGKDVVRVNGAGSWNINTGAGNDAIYSDNSGRQVITSLTSTGPLVESNAVWVFNTSNQTQNTALQPLYNLVSASAVAPTANAIANLNLTVSYRGITSTVSVGDTALATGGVVNDQTITQAIKAAINGDVYLHNLLSAADGTGRTLIVTSLTDGVFNDADISITVANGAAITAAQTTNLAAYISAAQLTALGLTAGSAVVGGRFDSAIAEDASTRTTETAAVTWTAFAAGAANTESAVVTWQSMAAVPGTQNVGGATITSDGAAVHTAAEAAIVAAGGIVAGLTLTTAPSLWTVGAAAGGTNVFTSTTAFTNVTNIAAGTATGAGNAAPTTVTTEGTASTQTIGGMTITDTTNAAFTAIQVAQVAGGGVAIPGITISTAPTLWTVGSSGGTATTVFSSTTVGNVTDITAGSFTGTGNIAPSQITTQGIQVSIVGANSGQASTNVIDAGLGFDTVVASTAGGTLAKGVITVADIVPEKDVVFNVSGGTTVIVDIADYVVSASGFILSGGAGTVAVLNTGINGTAGNDTIDGTNAAAGLTISGLAGNDTITASLLGGTVIGGDGADVITFAANTAADTLVFNSLVGADTIAGYTVANDVINLSISTFTGLTTLAGPLSAGEFESGAGLVDTATLAGRFAYNTTTGALFYDADGSGLASAPVLIATFTGIPALVVGEFVVIA